MAHPYESESRARQVDSGPSAEESTLGQGQVMAELRRLLASDEAISVRIGYPDSTGRRGEGTVVVADSADGMTQFSVEAYRYGPESGTGYGKLAWINELDCITGRMIFVGDVVLAQEWEHERSTRPSSTITLAARDWFDSGGLRVYMNPKVPSLPVDRFEELAGKLRTAVVNRNVTHDAFRYLTRECSASEIPTRPDLSAVLAPRGPRSA